MTSAEVWSCIVRLSTDDDDGDSDYFGPFTRHVDARHWARAHQTDRIHATVLMVQIPRYAA